MNRAGGLREGGGREAGGVGRGKRSGGRGRGEVEGLGAYCMLRVVHSAYAVCCVLHCVMCVIFAV